MIEFSRMEEGDYKSLLKFLSEHKIYGNEISKYLPYIFLIKENNKLYGIGIIICKEEDIYIEDIYVDEHQRNKGLGEGLLRTILHYARLNKKRQAYYSKDNKEMYNFLLNMGFKEDKDVLYINIESFFSRHCNSIR